MKRLMLVCMMPLTLCFVTACTNISSRVAPAETPQQRFWGSYTAEETYSYDHKYYAIQNVDNGMIKTLFLGCVQEEIVKKL